MNDFEKELSNALRRVEPPEGFAERVAARAARDKVTVMKPRPHWTRWAAAACLVIIGAAGGERYYQKRQAERAENARDQLLIALRLTGAQLDAVRQQVNERAQE
ncbi:MAG: hypothetical protein K2X35_00785 [Bryobacteraceae bacterium]|nr:hypothetical protein [Bryobacteraceae bacterium]